MRAIRGFTVPIYVPLYGETKTVIRIAVIQVILKLKAKNLISIHFWRTKIQGKEMKKKV